MNRSIRLFASLLVPAVMLAFATAAPAMKHEEKAKDAKAAPAKDAKDSKKSEATNTVKVLHEDDRVRVVETTTKPGEHGASIVRGKRVTRWLQGGTVERTYADGKKEKVERKTGEVVVAGPDKEAFSVTNVGKTTIVSYTVQIKEPKK
jgi:hypothetical protein